MTEIDLMKEAPIDAIAWEDRRLTFVRGTSNMTELARAHIYSELALLRENSPWIFERPARYGFQRGVDFYSAATFLSVIEKTARLFRAKHGYLPSLTSPKTFSEKLFFIKFFSNLPEPSLGDKLRAREFASIAWGSEILPEVKWLGTDPDGAPFNDLPPGKYYLKANHGSAMARSLQLPKDWPMRRDELRGAAKNWRAVDYGLDFGEWWYSTFQRLVFLERHIGEESRTPTDYKLYCFNGQVRMIHTDSPGK